MELPPKGQFELTTVGLPPMLEMPLPFADDMTMKMFVFIALGILFLLVLSFWTRVRSPAPAVVLGTSNCAAVSLSMDDSHDQMANRILSVVD